MKFLKNLSLSQSMAILLSVFIAIVVYLHIPSNAIAWDVFGYYLYLPMTFIYHDLGMKNVDVVYAIIEKYHNTATFYQAYQVDGGLWLDKYPMGMAILYLPSFIIGHISALICGYPLDGFSKPYQWALHFGSLAYTILGILFLRKVLLKFFNERLTALVLLLVVLGTNYYHNAGFSNTMSHNYLFAVYSMMLFFIIRWHETYKLKFIIGIAVTAGIAILSRPSEAICLVIPVLWGVYDKESLKNKWNLLLSRWEQILVFAVIIILMGLPQLIYWKWITGKYLYMSYNNPGEGFEFFHPYIKEVLFSFRKGWYIYTPMMFIATIGFYHVYKIKKEIFWALFTFIILNIYVVSSWSCWWYADSFGQRALVQSIAVMAIPLGFFIYRAANGKMLRKIITGMLCTFFLFLNLFQTWQVNDGIIHTSRMTYKYYWKVFLKTKIKEDDLRYLLVNRSYDGIDKIPDINTFDHTRLAKIDYDDSTETEFKNSIDNTYHHSGKYSLRLDSTNLFSPSYKTTFQTLTDKEYAWIRVSAYVYPVADFVQNPASLVVTFMHKEWNYKYNTIDLEKSNLKVNEWNKVSIDYLTPEVRSQSDKLSIYFWLRGKQAFYVDDLCIDIYEPREIK
jgi:hypothetical protein